MLKRIRELFGRRGPTPPPDHAERAAESSKPSRDGIAASSKARPTVHHGPKVVHRPIAESDLDADAVKIVRRLTRFDHTAYLVGGCVRDVLVGRAPKDFDIGTSATPRQVKRAFRNCRIIGRRFRLAHIYFQGGKIIEVATFRASDADDSDGDLLIRDDNVFGTPEEDALRRDFTVNQLFYDLANETVIDHAGGLDDLRRKTIRTIGDPDVRLREDPIRILRAIKFAARLDFSIEAGTAAAIARTREDIPKAAPPRILEELNRFCQGGAARKSFDLLRETGVFEVVLPEFASDYADSPEANALLARFLDAIDRRVEQGESATTGTLLIALVLPTVARAFGWAPDGSVDPPKGLDVRELTDERLRPMALRLRVARRDQEHCRQVLQTVFRMAFDGRLRAATRRGILRRNAFPESLWFLDMVGEELGGDLQRAAESWASREVAPAPARDDKREESTETSPPRRRRSRGGRGRRGRGKGPASAEAGVQAARPAPKSAGAKPKSSGRKKAPTAPNPDLPPPWDDRYFFAALPTVPEDAEATEPRAPEPAEAPETAKAQSAPPEESASDDDAQDGTPATRPRRRRRRRRRKPRSASGDVAGTAPVGDDKS